MPKEPTVNITAEQYRLLVGAECRSSYVKSRKQELGLKLGDIIASLDGITLEASGYEGPFVNLITKEGTCVRLTKAHCQILYHAFSKAIDWCEYGDAPGAC